MHELSKQVSNYRSLKRTIADLEQKLKEVEHEIKEYMGDQEEVVVDGTVIRWRSFTQSRFDVSGFKNQHEAMYEQFLVEVQVRRFQIT